MGLESIISNKGGEFTGVVMERLIFGMERKKPGQEQCPGAGLLPLRSAACP